METAKTLKQILAELKQLSHSLAQHEASSISTSLAKKTRKDLEDILLSLKSIIEHFDPVKLPSFVFDPSNPRIVGRMIGITLIAQDRKPLGDTNSDKFYGSGVYALYYSGDHPSYQPLANTEHPIYVGKADSATPEAKSAIEQGQRLSGRLNEHRRTIAKTESTLRVADFEYRALVVRSGWEASAETYLIDLFKPIWNNEMKICYGFGKHGDDPGTRGNLRSPWDTLHHGREWAHRDVSMKDARPIERITEDIARHLKRHPPTKSIDEIFSRFLTELRSMS